MHNKWDISKIEAVIQELNKRLDYQCNLKIEISKRAQKRMGAFFYRKNNGRIALVYEIPLTIGPRILYYEGVKSFYIT